MFFRSVSNNPGLRQQRDKIWQLCRQHITSGVCRVDKRIGFLNREVGSSFYWSFRMHGARNANAKCSAALSETCSHK